MDFKTYFFGMPITERKAFAEKAGTSVGLLTQVSYRNKRVELGFADVIVAVSRHAVGLDDLPLTDNAKRQRAIRESGPATMPRMLKFEAPVADSGLDRRVDSDRDEQDHDELRALSIISRDPDFPTSANGAARPSVLRERGGR